MTRHDRRSLFYGLLALFLVFGTGIVLYAQGIRFDFATGRIDKIGAIFIRSYPDDAMITINGKSVENQSGFLSHGTLISDLFPKTYSVKLNAQGYNEWHENVSVAPSLVTQLKYAILIPKNNIMAASGTVKNFSITNGQIAVENTADTIAVNRKNIGKGDITSRTLDGAAITFKNPNGHTYLYDIDHDALTDLTLAFTNARIATTDSTSIFVDPGHATHVIALGTKRIWSLDTDQSTASLIERTPAGETIGSAAIGTQFIAWARQSATGTSSIMLYDQYAQTIDSSTTVPNQNKTLAWIGDTTLGIIQDDGSMYLYHTDTRELKKLSDDTIDFSATPDGTMIATLEHKSLEVFSLVDASSNYYRFNLPNIANIQRLIWYKDDNHLFVVYPDHVSFLDLTDSSLTNFTTIGMGTSPAYDPVTDALYLIDPSGMLIRFDFSQ